MQLDTRASELKVDGYKALVRSDPEAQLEELAGDIATAEELIADPGDRRARWQGCRGGRRRRSRVSAPTPRPSVCSSIPPSPTRPARRRAGRRSRSPTTSPTVPSAAPRTCISESIATEQALTDTIARTQAISLLIAAAALLIIAGMSWLTLRSIKRPVERVKASLEALATGDLTVATGVTSTDEVGQMAASLDAAQTALREVLAAMAARPTPSPPPPRSCPPRRSRSRPPLRRPACSPVSWRVRPRRSPGTWPPWPRAPRRWVPRSARSPATPPRPARSPPRPSSPPRPRPPPSPSSGELGGDRQRRQGHHEHRRADQPAGAERHDRGRAGR